MVTRLLIFSLTSWRSAMRFNDMVIAAVADAVSVAVFTPISLLRMH